MTPSLPTRVDVSGSLELTRLGPNVLGETLNLSILRRVYNNCRVDPSSTFLFPKIHGSSSPIRGVVRCSQLANVWRERVKHKSYKRNIKYLLCFSFSMYSIDCFQLIESFCLCETGYTKLASHRTEFSLKISTFTKTIFFTLLTHSISQIWRHVILILNRIDFEWSLTSRKK